MPKQLLHTDVLILEDVSAQTEPYTRITEQIPTKPKSKKTRKLPSESISDLSLKIEETFNITYKHIGKESLKFTKAETIRQTLSDPS